MALSIVTALTILLSVMPLCLCAEVKQPEGTRPYQDGPLVAIDFQAKPPVGTPYTAWTETDFRYRYNYQYRTHSGETIVTLTELEVWAVVVREKSWNRRVRDALLMDHEQGHFDITQIHALEAQANIRARTTRGPKLQARATTKAAAVKQLEEKLSAALQPFMTDSLAAQQRYDKETANGQDAAAQALARRQHKERFEQLLPADETLAP